MPSQNTNCRECGGRFKKKRNSAASLIDYLEHRISSDGKPYEIGDWFCCKCKFVIKEGKCIIPSQPRSLQGRFAALAVSDDRGPDYSEAEADNHPDNDNPNYEEEPMRIADGETSDKSRGESVAEKEPAKEKTDAELAEEYAALLEQEGTQWPTNNEWPKGPAQRDGARFHSEQDVELTASRMLADAQDHQQPCCSRSVPPNNRSAQMQMDNQQESRITLDRDPSSEQSYEMHGNVQADYSEGTNEEPSQTHGRPRIRRKSDKEFYGDIVSIGCSERKCCVCTGGSDSLGRKMISERCRLDFWRSHRIYVPVRNRCCLLHLRNGKFNEESKAVLALKATKGTWMSKREITDLLLGSTSSSGTAPIDLGRDDLDEAEYVFLFGLPKEKFADLFQQIETHLRSTTNRSRKNALAMFLMKLRLAPSQQFLSFLFRLPQRKVSSTIWRVALLLEELFVPQHLGFHHIGREEIIALHDSNYVRRLYNIADGKIPLFFDGTYIDTEASGDHALQRKSYSSHKHKNLLKPMMGATSTGYIICCDGMYFSDGRHNDSKMLEDMFTQDDGIQSFVEEGDVFVVDRGFRDIEPTLRRKGIDVRMPRLLVKPQKQFTAAEANETRLVTMTRWVIESVNGRIKNVFRFFDMKIPAQYFNRKCNERLGRLFRISCALLNCYFPPLSQDSEKHDRLLEEVGRRFELSNTLKEDIADMGLDTRRQADWNNFNRDTLGNFPRLSMEELELVTLGIFQLKNARGYIDEHLKVDPDFKIQVHTQKPGLLRMNLRSKYCNAGSHKVWIEHGTVEGEDKIKRYYCKCRSGERTLGCCSHIAAVLWYLGYQRHEVPNMQPREFGTGIIEIVRQRTQRRTIDPIEMEEDMEDDVELLQDSAADGATLGDNDDDEGLLDEDTLGNSDSSADGSESEELEASDGDIEPVRTSRIAHVDIWRGQRRRTPFTTAALRGSGRSGCGRPGSAAKFRVGTGHVHGRVASVADLGRRRRPAGQGRQVGSRALGRGRGASVAALGGRDRPAGQGRQVGSRALGRGRGASVAALGGRGRVAGRGRQVGRGALGQGRGASVAALGGRGRVAGRGRQVGRGALGQGRGASVAALGGRGRVAGRGRQVGRGALGQGRGASVSALGGRGRVAGRGRQVGLGELGQARGTPSPVLRGSGRLTVSGQAELEIQAEASLGELTGVGLRSHASMSGSNAPLRPHIVVSRERETDELGSTSAGIPAVILRRGRSARICQLNATLAPPS